MASLIQRAADKQRAAMYRLFDRYHTSVYRLIYQLVKDGQAAVDLTALTFEKAWETISPAMTEAAFAEQLTVTAVELCKKHITRKDPKALRMPQDRRFAMSPGTTVVGKDLSPLETVKANFSVLQYTVLVLHHLSGLSDVQQAALLKWDVPTLHMAWEAQAHNVAFILDNTATVDDVACALHTETEDVAVPTTVAKRAEAHIRDLAAPQEKASRLKILKLTAVIVVITALTLVLCWSAVLSLSGVEESSPTDTSDTTASDTSGDTSSNAVTSIDSPTHYAEIAIKDHGTITVALDGNTAPITVENFKKLADEHFYDGLSFHRIIEGFMMQGGDPNADGTGGSDEEITGEFSANGIDNPLSHVRGAVSMARADSYDSASSQFFIVHEDSTYLDGDYAVFGYVTDGMDIVDTICTSAEPLDDNGTIEIGDQPVIETVTVYEAADYTAQ